MNTPLKSALQSFLDRLCNDSYAGTMFEGDADTLRDAISYIDLNERSKASAQADVAAVPEGWKLVPIEPTVTMLRVGEKWHETWMPNAVASVSNIYSAMLSAAPTSQPQADKDSEVQS